MWRHFLTTLTSVLSISTEGASEQAIEQVISYRPRPIDGLVGCREVPRISIYTYNLGCLDFYGTGTLKLKATPHIMFRSSPTTEAVWHDVAAPIFTSSLLFGAPVPEFHDQGQGRVHILGVLDGFFLKRFNIIDVDGKILRLSFTLLPAHLLVNLQA